MLSHPNFHLDELNRQFTKAVFDPRCRYYFQAGWGTLVMKPVDDTWGSIDAVSLSSDGKVLGYMSADINRGKEIVSSLKLINFSDKPSVTFGRDLREFLLRLVKEHRFHKICWNVAVGNPAEKMYDRIAEKHGGRIVGIYHEHAYLADGTRPDIKVYELLRSNFVE